jgi:hypothetical protein
MLVLLCRHAGAHEMRRVRLESPHDYDGHQLGRNCRRSSRTGILQRHEEAAANDIGFGL